MERRTSLRHPAIATLPGRSGKPEKDFSNTSADRYIIQTTKVVPHQVANIFPTNAPFYIDQILADGQTGRVAFDAMGDRMFAEYEVINMQGGQPEYATVGNYKYNSVLFMRLLHLNELLL